MQFNKGQVHTGTPRTPNSTIGANGLYKFEAKYDLSTESPLHSWGPKLAARYFNMNIKVETVLLATYSMRTQSMTYLSFTYRISLLLGNAPLTVLYYVHIALVTKT